MRSAATYGRIHTLSPGHVAASTGRLPELALRAFVGLYRGLDRRQRGFGGSAPGELRGPLRPFRGKAGAELVIIDDAARGLNHSVWIGGVEFQRGIAGEAGQWFDIGTGRGNAGRQGFQHRETEALETRRIDEGPRAGVEIVKLRARDTAGKSHGVS